MTNHTNFDVLNLFQGLTAPQVREFRARIPPTLQRLRSEILQTIPADHPGAVKQSTQRSENGKMPGENKDRQTV